jgi:hypothetical protein
MSFVISLVLLFLGKKKKKKKVFSHVLGISLSSVRAIIFPTDIGILHKRMLKTVRQKKKKKKKNLQ